MFTPPPVRNDPWSGSAVENGRTSGGVIRGLILAGGKSSRFGSNKALAKYQGVRLVERAVWLLNELDLKPVVVVEVGMDYSFLKCPIVFDQLPDQGPLGGIYTAMTIFKNTSFLVLTCDMPALTVPALSELLTQHETGSLMTAYSTPDGRPQPFPGVYESLILETICQKLEYNNLSMRDLWDRIAAKKLVPWKGERNIFININSCQDLRALETSKGVL